jgi:hypothetical protein
MTTPRQSANPRYLLCVSNRGYRASLMVRRVYRRLNDASADRTGLVRVVDETGEDYLFPKRPFVGIDVPREASRAFRAAG